MGAIVLMAGVLMLVLGAAGLLGTGGASYSRMRTAKTPKTHYGQLVVGVLLTTSGMALLVS
ncbi:hypothetical protein [Euzebya pacifica]|jgi:hypothetical protein|nr:hypothetical protein [Euzebya pacifica]